MKFLKWAALIVIVVAVIAAVVQLRRDAIARGIANSILNEQGIVVTDLSVESLTPNRLVLSRLVVESDGTRYEIRGLTLPLGKSGTRIRRFSAESLIVTYVRAQDAPSMLSTSLQTVLDLPLSRPGLDASLARVFLPNLPELINVSWATSETGQKLSFTVDTISVDVGVRRQTEVKHLVSIGATGNDGKTVLSADISLMRNDEHYSAAGPARISIGAWLPLMRSLDLLPAGLESLDAEMQGPIGILFDQNEVGNAVFEAQLGLVDALTATYRSADGSMSEIQVAAVDEFGISIDYPSFDWVARAGAMKTVLTTDDLVGIPTLLNDLECRPGTRCTMQAVVDAQRVRWAGYDFRTVKLSLPLTVDVDEVTRINIAAGATGKFTGVRTSDLSAESVSTVSFSGTELIVEDDFWHCRIAKLKLAVKRFESGEDLVASFPITFSDLDIRDSAQTVDTRLSAPPIVDAAWGGTAILLPGAEGTASIRGEQLTSSLKLKDKNSAVTASANLMFDLANDAGSIRMNDARVSFKNASLSGLAPWWPYPLDIVAGSWGADVNIKWQTGNAVTRYTGTLQFAMDGLAGRYNDIAFVGLSTNVSAKMNPAGGIDISPSSLAVRLVDIGLPLENIAVNYTIDSGKQTVLAEDLSFAALGGRFVAAPFEYSASAETNVIPLQAQSVQLQLMVNLLGSERIEMSGAISGELPVTIGETNITIKEGRLRSDPPGGVIRYKGDDGTLKAAVPDGRLSFVTRALGNFRFDSLTSGVDYDDAGDLTLKMRLAGINPDMDATQPIILNLSVENNIPQLLRSLQATRSIEDILERQAAKKAH